MNTAVAIPTKEQTQSGQRITWWQRAFVVAVMVIVIFMAMGPLILPPGVDNAHYFYLAQNLVQGKLSVDNIPSYYPDLVTWQGHTFLPLGPLPGVLLIPFLPLFLLGVQLVWVGYLFTALNVWLFYRVLGQVGVSDEARKWALLLFFGGTAYLSIAVIGSSYFFAHITTLTFMLAAITEALGKRRPIVIGLLLGLAAMVRLTAIFSLPFFLWLLWRPKEDTVEAAIQTSDRDTLSKQGAKTNQAQRFLLGAVGLLIGLVGPLLILGLYNYLRFGSFLESGYNLAILGYTPLREAREYGLFSLVHIPKNLVMMLFQGPLPYPSQNAPILLFPYMVPSPWGMGLLYTSPALLYAFRNKVKDTVTRAAILGAVFGMLPIITYYGVGWIQFGFRYALDFLPFVLILAARGFSYSMSRFSKGLVLAGVAVCLWGSTFLLIWINAIKLQ